MSIPWWIVVQPEDGSKLGTVIKDFFADMPISQGDLAKKLGVDQTAISRWANGKTSPTFEEFSRAVAAVDNRLNELGQRVTKVKQIVAAVQKINAAPKTGGLAGIRQASAAREDIHNVLKSFPVRKSGKRKSTKKK